MDQESLKLLDEIREYDDVVEVDFRHGVGKGMYDVRTVVGLYAGMERAHRGAWYLVVSGKATIRTIDIVSVRRKEPVEA